jgi:hypothetical protein
MIPFHADNEKTKPKREGAVCRKSPLPIRHGHKKVVCEEGSANGQPLRCCRVLGTFHRSYKLSHLIIF